MACEQTSSAASNDERQKDLERINVMFLCDEWKSSKGGLSTFNREFAVNLAKTTSDSIKVHCYVAQSDELSREDARQHGVNLITARNIPGSSDPLDWLKIPPSELPNPDIVVGHGRKFGTLAYFIVRAAKCKWMHFVHVFCEDLGKFKATQSAAVDTIEENEKKHKREIELCKAADVVVAVGSRLQQKYSKCLPHVEVEIITPGILETFSNESTQLVKDKSMVIAKKFSVFMFGRASFEDLTLKGYDIVANAIGSLDKMFELTFVGSSPGEHRKIEQWFLYNTCISGNQLTIRSYCNEQDELKMMFHGSDMIALPSHTEGFSLVALEAISAGIPVLVAGESGIAEALHEVEGGQSVIVESDDTEEWARRIQELSSQSPEERGNNAKLLRDNYNKTYPWSNECERFQKMIQDLAQSLSALRLKIDVETMKPAEHDTQAYRTPVSAVESGGSQNGQHQEASAVPVSSGQTQPSCTGAEAPQAPSPIPTEGEVLRFIATSYLQATQPSSRDDWDNFVAYMKEILLIITGVGMASLLITVKCDSLQVLERLWEDYSSGRLGEVTQRCFVTEEILTELSLAELRLKTTISEEEYKACKAYFEKDPARECGAVPVEESTHFLDEKNLAERDDEDDSLKQTDETDDKDDSVSDDEALKLRIKLRIGVETMKPAEHNTQERTPISTVESGGSRDGRHKEASAVSIGTEVLQASNRIPSDREFFSLIAANYLQASPLRSTADRDSFLTYMDEMGCIITERVDEADLLTQTDDKEPKMETDEENLVLDDGGLVIFDEYYDEDENESEIVALLVAESTHVLHEMNLTETDDEDDSLKQTDETDDKDDSVSDIEVERVILSETMKFEAEHDECVRVLPYLNNGDVEIHLYVYSDKCGIPTKLKNDAHAFFGQKGWKLKWADLYNDAFNSLQVTSIEYSSGGPKRLEASQVDEMEEIIDKHLHVFSNHRNVTAVRPSFKVTKSVQTEEACIVVYVLGKGQIPVGESAIPCTIGSYPVDIVNGFCVRTKDPYMPTKAHEQKEFLRLGASIGVRGKQSSGTLGAIVEDVKSGTLYALSCDHVMNDADESEIIHPGLDVYLNSLRFNLNGYKQWIERITKLSLELPQISDDSLEETELQKMFDYLKTERERHIDLERCRRSAKEGITKFETNLEEAFGKRPRVIASYSAGVRCNVGSEMHEGREHFIDAAISKLNEDEVENVKDEKEVVIIDTRHYPSGECISATTNATMDVEELFKSGSATDFTESNLILTTQRLPTFITDFRPNGDSAWIDVDCINCKKRGTAQSQVQELPGPCEQCRPYRWLKRCLCIQQQGKKPFSDKGDSGAVIFEKRKIKTEKGYEYQLPSRGFGIIFAELPSQNGNFAIASPLEIALEALSKKVSESRPDNEPCQLRLASTFCN